MIKTPLSTVLGGAFWTPGATVIGGNTPTIDQQIQKLFANGEQGFFYDPNDLSTMFQDAAGTIPVTAAGKPVGLILDKSGRNNHAFQTASASRPILQQTPILGSTNLTVNGDFSDGLTGWAAIGGASLSLTNSAIKVLNTGGGITEQAQQSLWSRVTKGKTYAYSVNVKEIVGIPRILVETSTVTVVNRTCPSVGTYTGVFTVPLDATSLDIRLRASVVASQYGVFDDVIVKEVTGYRTDQNYLAFDGTDDFLQTDNIDFTATDKVSLFAGVRKLSDASRGMIVELSSSVLNAGAFSLEGSTNGIDSYISQSNGLKLSIAVVANNSLKAPSNAVLTMKSDITSDYLYLKANQYSDVSVVDQGAGNFGNYPFFIGRRGGASFPFNGHIYGLIGIGKLVLDNETAAIEKELAKRLGVTLNV